MKLGVKILLTTASTFLGLIIVLFFISQTILLGSFEKLEQESASRNVERAMSALGEEIKSLSSLNLDWASWDDSYYFVKDRNREFIKSNLNNETLAKQRLCLIVFIDESGKTVFAKALDHHTLKEIPVQTRLKHLLSARSLLNTRDSEGKEGIIVLEDGFMMTSSRPILTSEGSGPVRGTLIMGRPLDKDEIKNLSEITRLNLAIVNFDDGVKRRIEKDSRKFSTDNGETIIRQADDEKLEGYGIVDDMFGKPAFMFRVDMRRSIYEQGKTALFYFIVYLMGAALVSAIAILLLLEKSVISRLLNLGGRVAEIGRTGNLAERVNAAGKDELAALSGEINRMLESLERLEAERKNAEEELRQFNDELEERVRERTAELEETNIELSDEVAERKRVEEAMREMIYHDHLTGLPNRLLFTDRLDQVIARRSRHKDTTAAVIFMDMDRFKVVNDSLGHTVGDELIKTVAAMMQNSLRQGDTVARIGGDEFIILIPDLARPEEVASVVDRILKVLKNPIPLMGHEVFITLSAGVSIYPYDGQDSVTLLKNADIAMYHAKGKGGNTYEMYNSGMAQRAFEKLTIGNKLRSAMERSEFVLYYQPQYDLRTGMITGSEALIRWQDPEKGLVSPASFIPIAEETGVIVQLGEWVVRSACALNKKLNDAGHRDLLVSVNVSARMFNEPGFEDKIRGALEDTGLVPENLILEITESLLMTNIVEAAKTIKNLKKTGLKFSVDDFGTGYSSLAYLKNLSIDELKIDRSFIMDLTTDQDDRLIIAAIVNLAHSLNLDVIAEGVELKEQLDFLTGLKCDKIQGYYFSRPVPEAAFIELLNSQKRSAGLG